MKQGVRILVASLADDWKGDVDGNSGSPGRWKGQLRSPGRDELQIAEFAGSFAYYSCSESDSWRGIFHGSTRLQPRGWLELAAEAPSYHNMSHFNRYNTIIRTVRDKQDSLFAGALE
jgi:hypothetical protein